MNTSLTLVPYAIILSQVDKENHVERFVEVNVSAVYISNMFY